MLRMLVRLQARQRRSWTRELRDRAAMRYAGTLAAFRERAAGSRRGYQTLINQALRDSLANGELEDTLRRVMREELQNAG